MARDLIPPPSPAGRPAPDGTPNLIELPPDVAPQVEFDNVSGEPSAYRNRFGFLIGGLGGVVIAAAAVAAIVIATGGTPDEGLADNWSAWKPQETTITAGPADIAAHVAPKYKGADGKQLLNVTGGPLQVENVKLGVLLQAQDTIHSFDGTTVMYALEGLGPNGSIKGGTPSLARQRLVRREALELALYTFRYMKDVDQVVTLQPTAPPSAASEAAAAAAAAASSSSSSSSTGSSSTGSDTPAPTQEALFYRPGDLKAELQVPLGQTVPAKAPQPNTIPSGQAQVIDALTLSNMFYFSFQQLPTFGANIVLDRTAP
jgi:hypothetical protein